MFFDLRDQLFDYRFIGIIGDEQQIQIFIRFDLARPFVFDRLHTVKLYQSLFDLVRSVASQDLQLLIHAGQAQSDVGQFIWFGWLIRALVGRDVGGAWRPTASDQHHDETQQTGLHSHHDITPQQSHKRHGIH